MDNKEEARMDLFMKIIRGMDILRSRDIPVESVHLTEKMANILGEKSFYGADVVIDDKCFVAAEERYENNIVNLNV